VQEEERLWRTDCLEIQLYKAEYRVQGFVCCNLARQQKQKTKPEKIKKEQQTVDVVRGQARKQANWLALRHIKMNTASRLDFFFALDVTCMSCHIYRSIEA